MITTINDVEEVYTLSIQGESFTFDADCKSLFCNMTRFVEIDGMPHGYLGHDPEYLMNLVHFSMFYSGRFSFPWGPASVRFRNGNTHDCRIDNLELVYPELEKELDQWQ